MDTLTHLISNNIPAATLALLLATVGLAVMVIVQTVRVSRLQRTWRDLMRGANGQSLESLLLEHLAERKNLQSSVSALEQRSSILEKKMTSSLRYVGVVRYDAFEDVGATQSWSMAFYDELGNGAVISCLYGRADCRVYSKVLEGGKADRSLTGEEQAAIEAAGRGGRSVVRA